MTQVGTKYIKPSEKEVKFYREKRRNISVLLCCCHSNKII